VLKRGLFEWFEVGNTFELNRDCFEWFKGVLHIRVEEGLIGVV
jgi:hypothetical protein